MAFEVTATRRRPQNFEHLVGQDFLVSTLTNSIKAKRIAHAYLFSGPRGVGKTSSARILAKALNCANGPTETPCGTCPSCLEITQGNCLDVIEIDGASNTSVNDIREIKDEVLFSPNASLYKIYIIDEVHMLSNSAFNALLKTIEEPPPYIVFIFATTEAHKVPATIRSRCQQFNFRLIEIDIIMELLKSTCAESSIQAEEDALLWIAKESTGSMRDAYTLFDQIASFSNQNITLNLIKEKLGLVGFDQINSIVTAMIADNRTEMLSQIEAILNEGVSVEQFIIDLSDYFRSLLFINSGITKESIIGYKKERLPEEILNAYSVARLEYALTLLFDAFRNIRYSLNQRFELELLLSKLCSLNNYLTAEELNSNLEQMKQDILNGAQSLSTEAVDCDEEEKDDRPDVSIIKQKLIDGTKKDHVTLSRNLTNAKSWGFTNGIVEIYFENKFSANQVKENILILNSLMKNMDASWPIEIKLQNSAVDESEETGKTSNEAVEMVKKVFRGEIIAGE